MASTIVVGVSGSGKSHFARAGTAGTDLVYTVNAKVEDYPSARPISLKRVLKARRNSGVVLEDISRPTEKDLSIIRKLLVYTKRYKNISVFMLTHSVTRSNVYSILPFFDRTIFTRHASNSKAFREYARYLDLEPVEARAVWNGFISESPSHSYLVYKDGSFEITYADGTSVVTLRERAREKMSKILRAVEPSNRAEFLLSLFDFVSGNLSLAFVDMSDLSVVLESSKRGRLTANLVDFVIQISDPKSPPPTKPVIVLYLFLKTLFSIPAVYVQNSHFSAKALKAFNETEQRELLARQAKKIGRKRRRADGKKEVIRMVG
jgi:hypothetical protein